MRRSAPFPSVALVRAALLLAATRVGCGSGESFDATLEPDSGYVRPPAVAGTFYPSDSSVLARTVDLMLGEASSPSVPVATPVAGVVPHAGYAYSGRTAAHFYRLLADAPVHPDVVILVSAAHSAAFRGVSVFGGGAYLTPLGPVPVDRETARRLREAHPAGCFDRSFHRDEHTIEVQLPFLQRVLDPGFRIVPVLLGQTSEDELRLLAELLAAEAIAASGSGSALLVLASSDLAHYPSRESATRLDSATVSLFLQADPGAFLEGVAALERSDVDGLVTCACGQTAMFVVLCYSRLLGPTSSDVLHVSTSADAGGDPRSVVGYAAMAVFLDEDRARGRAGLGPGDRSWLCSVVRDELEASVRGDPPLSRLPPADCSPVVSLPAGAFVTYRVNGRLRGCIGTIRPVMPLYRTVAGMARAAATEDPRFPPIGPDELDDIEFSISVLTPMQLVDDPEQVRVGIDGLYITMEGSSGVLLPQVPVEFGWSREEFLEAVCRKAGLPADAYLSSSSLLYRFQAEVFGPADLPDSS